MSSTLGQGYVALTPINLHTLPSALEGSKAGLLTLFWSDVFAEQKVYSIPVNLLLAYQTGQFTTVQSLLVDNSETAYPVIVTSQSTGQRVVVPAYAQSMTPLLVSVAPQFTVTLSVPSGVTVPVDKSTSRFWFLNTRQEAWITTGLHTGSTNSLLGSGTATTASGGPSQNTPITLATLAPAFQPGGIYETYLTVTLTISQLSQFLVGGLATNTTVTFQTAHGGVATWQASLVVPSASVAGALGTLAFTYPANVLDSTGDPILLRMLVATAAAGSTYTGGVLSVSYSFYYSVTAP
jgi:hypothetical protein